MPIVRSHTSSGVSVTEPSRSGKTPALLYRTVSPPKVSTVKRTMASASEARDTSACTYAACAPPSRMAAATASPASSATSLSTTLAPSRANSCEATLPMPLAPPVIKATLPSSRPIHASLRPLAARVARRRPENAYHHHAPAGEERGRAVEGEVCRRLVDSAFDEPSRGAGKPATAKARPGTHGDHHARGIWAPEGRAGRADVVRPLTHGRTAEDGA